LQSTQKSVGFPLQSGLGYRVTKHLIYLKLQSKNIIQH